MSNTLVRVATHKLCCCWLLGRSEVCLRCAGDRLQRLRLFVFQRASVCSMDLSPQPVHTRIVSDRCIHLRRSLLLSLSHASACLAAHAHASIHEHISRRHRANSLTLTHTPLPPHAPNPSQPCVTVAKRSTKPRGRTSAVRPPNTGAHAYGNPCRGRRTLLAMPRALQRHEKTYKTSMASGITTSQRHRMRAR